MWTYVAFFSARTIAAAPRHDEIVVIVALADGGRQRPRVGEIGSGAAANRNLTRRSSHDQKARFSGFTDQSEHSGNSD
jgi:hypothetical protein